MGLRYEWLTAQDECSGPVQVAGEGWHGALGSATLLLECTEKISSAVALLHARSWTSKHGRQA